MNTTAWIGAAVCIGACLSLFTVLAYRKFPQAPVWWAADGSELPPTVAEKRTRMDALEAKRHNGKPGI